MKNLAPKLIRQRIIIEGTTAKIVEPPQIERYLIELADVTKMERLAPPRIYSAHNMGYGAWQHWKTSGTTFYSYPVIPRVNPVPLFTVDCYTCKPFDAKAAAEWTAKFFDAVSWDWMEVKF